MAFTYTNQPALREAFWDAHPELRNRAKRGPRGRLLEQNKLKPDARCAWVDWIDSLAAAREISPALAQRATL